jgi:hypothetical protein
MSVTFLRTYADPIRSFLLNPDRRSARNRRIDTDNAGKAAGNEKASPHRADPRYEGDVPAAVEI